MKEVIRFRSSKTYSDGSAILHSKEDQLGFAILCVDWKRRIPGASKLTPEKCMSVWKV